MKTVTVTVRPEDERDEPLVKNLAAQSAGISPNDIAALVLQKKSVDARHGQVKFHLRYEIILHGQDAASAPGVPVWKKADPEKRVVIVGAGPAGLFAALKLLENGVTPVIVEQGKRAQERKRDIASIASRGIDARSNYCFGEGGAGAFSDGKLFSRSKKRGSAGRVLSVLCHFGAPAEILTDAHPHIGSDKLPAIISAITDRIVSLGSEIYFETECTGFVMRNGRVAGVVSDGREFPGNAVILAAGHSSRAMYELIQQTHERAEHPSPAPLEAKPFAVGVRVEHPRAVIDAIQYHTSAALGGDGEREPLPAAEYRLTAQIDGRGVYSFCMCPGGIVVPAASAPDEIVLNGMSPSGRNTRWSNAAIVVETRPEDCGAEDPLAGLRFRAEIERRAFKESDSQAAPAQRITDFLAGKKSQTLPPSSYAPGLVSSRLDEWLPAHIVRRLRKAFVEFERKMHGFIREDALVIAPETRTSTPVRIMRGDNFESAAFPGLFPCGEGSGYAGGIMSSAIDGENAARAAEAAYNGRVSFP